MNNKKSIRAGAFAATLAITALATTALTATALAQTMPDIGFRSVGRGWPVADVQKQREVGPRWVVERGRPQSEQKLDGFRPPMLPPGIQPLPRDLFNSPDFYADRALWTDKRYFRCNSPAATEMQMGVLTRNALTTDPAQGPWGNCDVDYPRDSIVSPYGFRTAQDHYEALKKEARSRGTLKDYTFKDFPAVEWKSMRVKL